MKCNEFLTRPKGEPLLLCDCDDPNGWPLLVWRDPFPDELFTGPPINTGKIPAPVALGVTVTSDKRLRGCCPNCKRQFAVFVDAIVDPGELAAVGFLAYSHFLPDGWVIETDHVRWGIKESQATAVQKSQGREISSPRGMQFLRVKTLARERFANAVDRAIKSGMDAADFPDWTPAASDQQFQAWTREIDREVMRRGLIPVGVKV